MYIILKVSLLLELLNGRQHDLFHTHADNNRACWRVSFVCLQAIDHEIKRFGGHFESQITIKRCWFSTLRRHRIKSNSFYIRLIQKIYIYLLHMTEYVESRRKDTFSFLGEQVVYKLCGVVFVGHFVSQ